MTGKNDNENGKNTGRKLPDWVKYDAFLGRASIRVCEGKDGKSPTLQVQQKNGDGYKTIYLDLPNVLALETFLPRAKEVLLELTEG